MIKQQLAAKQTLVSLGIARQQFPPSKNNARPAVLRTTIDSQLQSSVAGIARRHLAELASKGGQNIAVIVVDNTTGAILSWEGSGSYFGLGGATGAGNGQINGPLQPRQTGSTIKPFIYAADFDAGESPGDTVTDSPINLAGKGVAFKPENYDHRFRGTISLRRALGSSINVAAIKVLSKVGPETLVAELGRVGIDIPGGASRNGLALGLGSAEVDLVDLVKGYTAFGRDGTAIDLTLNADTVEQRIANPTGAKPNDESVGEGGSETPTPPWTHRLVSAGSAFMVADVLADNRARSEAFGPASALTFPFPVGAKTGTSQNFHDNWVIGFTPKLTVGVWVGNFDRSALRGATGVSGAGPIFHDVMLAAHDRVSPDWGASGTGIWNEIPSTIKEQTDLGGEYQWKERPAIATAHGRDTSAPHLVSPSSGEHLLIDPQLSPLSQALPLRVSNARGRQVRFTVTENQAPSDAPALPESTGQPGAPLSTTIASDANGAARWRLQPGRFRICAAFIESEPNDGSPQLVGCSMILVE